MNDNKRESGYYWIRVKRTKIWVIAKWFPSLNNGKGHWDTAMLENDTRGGFDLVYPNRLIAPVIAPVKRERTATKMRTKRIRTK